MNLDDFALEVKKVNWHDFKGSEYYKPEEVAISLIALSAADEESKEGIHKIEGVEADLLLNAKITQEVGFAIGNFHSGTYYPAIRKALPFIIQIALSGNHLVARNCAINILIDIYYFCPECNDGSDSEKDLMVFVKSAIKNMVSENRDIFVKFATDNPRNESLIKSLLEIIE